MSEERYIYCTQRTDGRKSHRKALTNEQTNNQAEQPETITKHNKTGSTHTSHAHVHAHASRSARKSRSRCSTRPRMNFSTKKNGSSSTSSSSSAGTHSSLTKPRLVGGLVASKARGGAAGLVGRIERGKWRGRLVGCLVGSFSLDLCHTFLARLFCSLTSHRIAGI